MKKFVFSTILLTSIIACKKESAVTETTDSTLTSESAEFTDSTAMATASFKKVEWSPEQASAMLENQKNDTLYVNNFFATWCGPCMQEIPHFKEKMAEMKGQPVKFTFIDLDQKSDWDTKVKEFALEQNLSDHIVLVDGSQLSPAFFKANFSTWDGGAIPFTFIRKGEKTDETIGSMSKEMLAEKLNSFK